MVVIFADTGKACMSASHRSYPRWWMVFLILAAAVYHTDIMETDQKRSIPNMPLQTYGRHSLESYGYRLGEYKGEFGKTTDWQDWSPDMETYCCQDVKVTTTLCDHFHKYLSGSD